MQNKLVAIAAFGFGVLVGWAFTADRLERRLKDAEENAEALWNKLLEPVLPKIEDVELGEGEIANQPTLPFDDSGEENLRGSDSAEVSVTGGDEEAPDEPIEVTRGRLQGLIDTYTKNPEDAANFSEAASFMVHDKTPPFVISKEKYAWDEEEGDEYEKLTVTFYPSDRVILDDDDELIVDVDNIIGWRNLNQFGGESGDADVVFVRNRRMRTDFEVVRDEENPIPLHIKYGMGREEFEVGKAAGTLRLREEDQ